MNQVIRLRKDTSLGMLYADRTPFGGPIGTRPDDLARSAFSAVVTRRQREGVTIRLTGNLLDEVRSTKLFSAITTARPGGWTIRENVLYPSRAGIRPAFVTGRRPGATDATRVAFPRSCRHEFHEAISRLSDRGYCEQELTQLQPEVQALITCWLDQGLVHFEDAPPEPMDLLRRADVTFVGHNTVVIRDTSTTIMFDPYFYEASVQYPDTYQPIQPSELGRLDAVVLTHSHRDHFDAASLLQIPPSTTIYAPAVERESILTVDMGYRLEELGFEDVRTLRWGDIVTIGTITLRALPFYGEQPTDDDWFHSEIRNHGCTYLIRTSTWAAALLADSGSDHSGNAKALAARCHQEFGPVDIVFSGYRGWVTYPAQLLGSSIARYALFIPPEYWGARMQLMNSIDDALDVAERWGARYLCPYGDGGAPWHWHHQLGPRLDGGGKEVEGFDPFPERVVQAATSRSVAVNGERISSPTQVVLLRPGDSLRDIGNAVGPGLVRVAGHIWPFAEEPSPAAALRSVI
jgi:L-ascorbate metabolism protein UlaG (beta-lactamase superfamily)